MGSSSKKPVAKAQAVSPAKRDTVGNGVLLLLALNYLMFVLDNIVQVSWASNLYFWGQHPRWWQFVTSAFCHANFGHLAGNMFLLYVFGKTVEDEEGATGVLVSYLFCAVGGVLANMWISPNTNCIGASAAVFGLFVMSSMLKMSFNFRKLLELAAITPFVVGQVTSNITAQAGGALSNVSYAGHLGGAAAGFLLFTALSMLPEVKS